MTSGDRRQESLPVHAEFVAHDFFFFFLQHCPVVERRWSQGRGQRRCAPLYRLTMDAKTAQTRRACERRYTRSPTVTLRRASSLFVLGVSKFALSFSLLCFSFLRLFLSVTHFEPLSRQEEERMRWETCWSMHRYEARKSRSTYCVPTILF